MSEGDRAWRRPKPDRQPISDRKADDATLQSAREAVLQSSKEAAVPHQDGPAVKKARFDVRNPSRLVADDDGSDGDGGRGDGADQNDDDLDLDEIGRKRREGKRNGVALDGYESDSSDDNFDIRARDKARLKRQMEKKAAGKASGGGDDDDDDDDMFAGSDEESKDEDDDEGDDAKPKRDRRTVTLLGPAEIDGEVSDSGIGPSERVSTLAAYGIKAAGADDDDGDDEDDGGDDDEERARPDSDQDEELGAGSKKRKAPRMDAFNMVAERTEGRFDNAGNFIRNAADPDAAHDSWLVGLSKKQIRQARLAAEERQNARKAGEDGAGTTADADLLAVLIRHLNPGDTVLDQLGQLGQAKKLTLSKKSGRKAGANKVAQGDTATQSRLAAISAAIQGISAAADELMSRDTTDNIYDCPRELLIRLYRRHTGADWIDPEPESGPKTEMETTAGPTWLFRWTKGPSEGQVMGPYDAATMASWLEAGYFADPDAVEFQQVVSDQSADWVRRVVQFGPAPA